METIILFLSTVFIDFTNMLYTEWQATDPHNIARPPAPRPSHPSGHYTEGERRHLPDHWYVQQSISQYIQI